VVVITSVIMTKSVEGRNACIPSLEALYPLY